MITRWHLPVLLDGYGISASINMLIFKAGKFFSIFSNAGQPARVNIYDGARKNILMNQADIQTLSRSMKSNHVQKS